MNTAMAARFTRANSPAAFAPAAPGRMADGRVAGCLDRFASITLEETNRLARMLSRVDNKYTVNAARFEEFAGTIGNDFAVLAIEGRTHFTYTSCYYDDDYACYHDHHQGRRQRFKVRTREYVDTGARYFELKFKGRRGITEKHRAECDYLVSPRLPDHHLQMLRELHQSQYRRPMPYALRPTLVVGYRRCTLVALAGGERVTVDYGISFAPPEHGDPPVRIGENFIIVETKSADGRGIADRVLKSLRVRQASNCSKYCIGVNLTGAVRKGNNFLTTVNQVRRNVIECNEVPRVLSPVARWPSLSVA